MCMLALHRIIEVGSDPFDTDLAVVDTAGVRILRWLECLDEEIRSVGEQEDRHFGFCLFDWERMRQW